MRLGVIVALTQLASAGVTSAAETVNYTYDALGRLTGSIISGGPNSGVSTGTSFDPAGNRSGYSVTGGVALADPPHSVLRPMTARQPREPSVNEA